jgi:hypothetical protein
MYNGYDVEVVDVIEINCKIGDLKSSLGPLYVVMENMYGERRRRILLNHLAERRNAICPELPRIYHFAELEIPL